MTNINVKAEVRRHYSRARLKKNLYIYTWIKDMVRRVIAYTLIGASLVVGGCNHNPHPQDPLEGLNREIFGFNKTIDQAIAKPVAYLYLNYLPQPMQLGIGNFFDNLREIPNITNDLLQLEFAYMAHDTSRFLINSTLGIFGFFDPATSLGLEHRKNDFGQTLYQYGYHNSAYLMLPFLGPSTVRDVLGLGVDYYALSIWPWIESDWRYGLLAIDYIDIRARALRHESVINAIAVDEYVLLRDAYFQRRQFLFNKEIDGNNDLSGNDVDPYSEDGDDYKAKNHNEKATENALKEIVKTELVKKDKNATHEVATELVKTDKVEKSMKTKSTAPHKPVSLIKVRK